MEINRICKVLGNEKKYKIWCALDEKPKSLTRLVEITGLNKSYVYRALQDLLGVGLCRREGWYYTSMKEKVVIEKVRMNEFK